MTGPRRSFGFLSSPWLVSGSSLLTIAALSVLLWSPWDRPSAAGGRTLRLYCAAGMTKPVARIIHDYQKTYGVTVEPTYGGSGELLSTIRGGAPGDLYLAADALNMEQAQESGHVAESIPVAVIRPVIIVNKKTQEALRKQGRPVTSAADLLRKDLKVVLAHDAGTSIGRVVKRVLEPAGTWAALERRRKDGSGLVSTVGTVNKVALTVRTGAGYVGVAWDAVALQFDDLEVIDAPEFKGVCEHVSIGVLTRSPQPTAALKFARYLTARDRGMEVFRQARFTPIADADAWAEQPHLHLAAGAMLLPAVDDVIKAFKQREGVEVETSYNGCGVLVSQMKSLKGGQKPGAFPDAYFACDASFLDDVRQWFDPGVNVSRNDMVLIVPRGNPRGVRSLEDLARPDLRAGLAHPKNSALGKLTDELLKKLALHERVYAGDWSGRVAHADAAHLLVNQMRAGALDVAVVYRSNAMSAPENTRKHLDVLPIKDEDAHAVQPFAIAAESRHKYLLRRLQQALTADASARRFQSLGFEWIHKAK